MDCEILVDEWGLNMRLDFGLIMVMMMMFGLISSEIQWNLWTYACIWVSC